MVASNAFILEEMKEKAKVEGMEKGIEREREEIAKNLLDILDNNFINYNTIIYYL